MATRGNKPGAPKTGGRKAGTPNKRTQELIELLEATYPGFHPVMAMVDLAHAELEAIQYGGFESIDDLREFIAECDEDEDRGDARLKAVQARLVNKKEFALSALDRAAPYFAPKRKAVDLHVDELPTLIIKDYTSGGVNKKAPATRRRVTKKKAVKK